MVKKAIRPLHTKAEYEAKLDEIERYLDREPKPGTAEVNRFDLLSQAIEDYEKKYWPIEPADTAAAGHRATRRR